MNRVMKPSSHQDMGHFCHVKNPSWVTLNLITTPHSQPLTPMDLHSVPIVLPFLGFLIKVIIEYVVFVVGFLYLASCCRFSSMFYIFISPSFYSWTVFIFEDLYNLFCLSDIWVDSSLNNAPTYICLQVLAWI